MCVFSRVDSGADYGLYPRGRFFQRYHLMHPAVPMHRLSWRLAVRARVDEGINALQRDPYMARAAAPSDKESP